MAKKTLTAKVSPQTLERLEEWAEEKGISKSEATNRLLDKSLDIEEDDKFVVMTDGKGEQIETTLAEVDSQLSEIDEQVVDIQSSFRKEFRKVQTAYVPIGAALLWLVLEVSFGFPAFVTISSGIGLIAILLLSLYWVYRGDSE
jgi:hypothetical protein